MLTWLLLRLRCMGILVCRVGYSEYTRLQGVY